MSKARDLFFNYGLKSVSMDDLAKEAGVSKKTIYQFVSDKGDLVIKVAEHLLQCHQAGMDRSYQDAENAVEEVVLQSKASFMPLTTIRYSFFYDMEKFFPDAWKLVEQSRQQHLLPNIVRNLERGLNEGVYREDLDLELTPHIRLQQLQSVLQPGAFSAFQSNLLQLMTRLTRFYLHGITSSKGSQLINKYLHETSISKLER